MRLIDADELFEYTDYQLKDAVKYGNKDSKQQDWSYSTLMMYEIADEIKSATTIELGDLIGTKHGEWLDFSDVEMMCSECREIFRRNFYPKNHRNYCPSCGAKMFVKN